jgi:hypothetical protein
LKDPSLFEWVACERRAMVIVLGIISDLCQRRAQFDVEALKAQHGGDVKMPELLSQGADFLRQRQRAFSVY